MPTIITRGAGSAVGFGLFGTVAAATDPYFNYNTLLLPGNGTNGGQNNTFLDSGTANSGSGFTITRNGNTTQGTFSPFSQTGWSNYFDGSSDYLAYSGITMGTNAFTIECFFMSNSFGSLQTPFGCSATTGNLSIRINNATTIQVDSWNFNNSQFTVPTMSVGQWYHLVITRDSSNRLTVFLNGTRSSTGSVTNSTDYGATKDIGWQNADYPSFGLNGYMSQVRIVNGQAVYDPTQTTITVPTAPLTTTGYGSVSQGITASNTKLLTCQSNYFVDNSSSPFTLTPNGSVSVQAFSPFAPTAAYSASTVGGSGYFDGSGDYLTVANNAALQFGTGTFTVEAWVYLTASSTYQAIIGPHNGDGAWVLRVDNSSGLKVAVYTGSTLLTGSTTVLTNSWVHIAMVREGTGSNQFKVYVNGTVDITNTVSNDYTQSNTYYIGAQQNNLGSTYLSGYVSSIRVVKGTAVYTGNFTPPTAPLTNITNTSLLLNFTNAAIIDNTAKNVLETVGNAQISTTQSKFGGASLYFDGSGDRLTIPFTNDFLELGINGQKFTVEAWIYPTNTMASTGTVLSKGGGTASWSTSSGAQYQWAISSSALTWEFNSSGSAISVSGGTLTLNAWQHIAITYDGTTTRSFLNGVQQATSTSSYTAPTTRNLQYIGMTQSGGYTQEYYGYIDDLRITKGIARYTSNFTPPTAAFPLQ